MTSPQVFHQLESFFGISEGSVACVGRLHVCPGMCRVPNLKLEWAMNKLPPEKGRAQILDEQNMFVNM